MKYLYFVSYAFRNIKGFQLGQCTLAMQKPALKVEDINEMTDFLKKTNRCKKCVILNYKLMETGV